MAKSDLLKQAIADAKTVKETALANAKIALQEAFTPRIKEMLANKLTNEIEGEEGDEMDASIDAGAAAGAEGDMGDDFTWTDDTLAASVGGNDYSFQVGMAGTEDDAGEMPVSDEAPISDEEMTAEYNEGMDMENPEDLNLESIIRELEGDLEDPMMGHDTAETSELGEDYMYEEDAEDLMSMNVEEGDENIEEIIESILREAEEEEMMAAEPTTPMSEEEEMMEAMEMELDAKEEELKEAYRTVKHLQTVINEVNLLNAKLLYTNKLFRNFELTEAQKMKVIENFDRAGNTRETKLVFTTLAESFKKPKMKKRVVKESYAAASRPVTTTAPSVETTQVLSEGFELANRWKKLAGLL
jgi:hypothetical protein